MAEQPVPPPEGDDDLSGRPKALDRRSFLRHGAMAGAAAVTPSGLGATSVATDDAGARTAAPQVLRDDERCGSDYMIDVLKSLDFDYVCVNPGSSFRGLHESLINHGGNIRPEMLTCTHEESAVAMAHAYFKASGKPLAVMAHGTVGLQHAAMAIYNAWCDRVPVYIILGNMGDAAERRGAEWYHGVQDAAAMVRDYTKWDDYPWSLTHFAESAVRAYRIAITPPMAPVVLVVDSALQERPIPVSESPPIPRLTLPSPPQGDSAAVEQLAEMLASAEQPVLVADRFARTSAAMPRLVELAELLQAAVIDQGSRMNFPSRHVLNQSQRAAAAVAAADLVVGLEVADLWSTINSLRDQLKRSVRRIAPSTAKVASITTADLYIRANYQDFRRMAEVDLAIAADAEATLPALIEAVRRRITPARRRAFEGRGRLLAEQHRATDTRFRTAATFAWDASPVSLARLCADLWDLIRHDDWSLVSSYFGDGSWPKRLWDFDKPYQWLGHAGGAGIGYGLPASIGGALANRPHGRLSVSIQSDGDFMYAPGILWTAAHHRIPLLIVMHNNRAYHQEVMHVQRMANARNRGIDRARIGNELTNPNVDYAKLAQSLGIYAEGPISDPVQLRPALQRALAVVRRGEPALVDVVTQVR